MSAKSAIVRLAVVSTWVAAGWWLAQPCCVAAAEPPVAWEAKIGGPGAPADAKVFFEPRGSGQSGDAVVVNEVTDGVLRYGLKYDAARPVAGDRLNFLFGDCVWWSGITTAWGPFDLKQFPYVEITWRGLPTLNYISLYYAIETVGGEKVPSYAFFEPGRNVRDAQGREWNVSTMRLGPPAAVSSPTTPARLLGLNFVIGDYGPSEVKGDVIYEIAALRLRGFTADEAAREKKVLASLTDFPAGRWRGFDTFFPFGVYDTGFLRGDFEYWGGDYEGAFGTFSRHHLNYIASNYEVMPTRLGAHSSEEGFKAYLAEFTAQIERAKATGVKLSGDVRDLHWMADLGQGHEGLLPIMKRIAAVAPDDDTLVSWQLADEPWAADVAKYAMMIRAVRENDPLTRPELLVFNNATALKAYGPYLSVGYWDNYPVLSSGRNPWAIRDLARDYRKALPGKPVWAVLQAFEMRPPVPKGAYLRPSDAEMRLMAYLSLSEGVKGLIWFSGWGGSSRDEYLVERAGQARGGMLETLADLGRRLIPLGSLFLATEPLEGAGVEVKQLTEAPGERGVSATVLQHRSQPCRCVLVINEDLEHTRQADVTLPAALVGPEYGVYDLYALDGANLLQDGRFRVAALSGGDARLYLVATAPEFARQQARIQCDTAQEDLRALTPDLTLARRWNVPLERVAAGVAAVKAAVQAGDGPRALDAAALAQRRVREALANDSEVNAVRHALADMENELTEVGRVAEFPSEKPRWWTGRDHPMMVPNPGFLEESKRYWAAGRTYAELRRRYLSGDRQGLWPEVQKASIECLQMREAVLRVLRQKLEPAAEPAPAK
jgi:hypothetical protein